MLNARVVRHGAEKSKSTSAPKPYCLAPRGADSPGYYETVSDFADRVLMQYRRELSFATADFETYVRKSRCETPRGVDEYTFELLLLGTLWNLYAPKASKVPAALTWTLSRLVEMRREYPRHKKKIDAVRGFMGALFLASTRGVGSDAVDCNTQNLKKLIDWLKATGEYSQEAVRLDGWFVYLESCESRRVEEILGAASRTARRFEAAAASDLGIYTQSLEAHKKARKKAHRFGENYFLFGKKRVEYHLSMLGAEVLNRSMRSEFLRTKRRIVLLPGCMRGENERLCRARRRGLDITCVGCIEGCHVGQLRRQGKTQGFEVRIISHSSGFVKWLDRWRDDKDIGIVGVTCVPNVLQGGFEMKKRGVLSQCVLLEFAGCQKHWLPRSVPTCIDRQELCRSLGCADSRDTGSRAS